MAQFALIILSVAVVLLLCLIFWKEVKNFFSSAENFIKNVEFEAGLKEAHFRFKVNADRKKLPSPSLHHKPTKGHKYNKGNSSGNV